MEESQFIELRSQGLAKIVRQYLHEKAEYTDVNDYTWDTLNAWQDYCSEDKQPNSEQECVFWHLMYTLHLWDKQDLESDRLLRIELQDCAAYLMGQGHKPQGCIGARP